MSFKDLTEALRNLAAAAGILVGGGWVLYEWTTLFPKTEAEVSGAAAMMRADVRGSLSLTLGNGSVPRMEDGRDFAAFCADEPREVAVMELPMLGALSMTNEAAIPMRVDVDQLQVTSFRPRGASLHAGRPALDDAFAFVPGVKLFRDIPLASIVGGLFSSRVEKGQTASAMLVLRPKLQFDCRYLAEIAAHPPLFAIGVLVYVTGIDSRSGADIAESRVWKSFTQVCRVSAQGSADCTVGGSAGGI